jgi:hypothetical protein
MRKFPLRFFRLLSDTSGSGSNPSLVDQIYSTRHTDPVPRLQHKQGVGRRSKQTIKMTTPDPP